MKYFWLVFLGVMSLLFTQARSGYAMLGLLEPEARSWAMSNGFNVGTTQSGTEGCRKDKRFIPFEKDGVKGYGMFYHPGYSENTGLVASVEFEFDPPVGMGQARSYGILVAPIVGTRGATHQQKIKADKSDPCVGDGGTDERYTQDYIVEFYNAPGGKGIRLIRLYNDYVR